MKEKYMELMERALSAYSHTHIQRYLNDVKENGLSEHGFPRLTANIGILIAHGRRKDLLPTFIDMMDVCCEMFLRPYVKAANEFSVREILCCIKEIEDARAVAPHKITQWKQDLAQILPEACYDVIVRTEADRIFNWAIFGAVSEYVRYEMGLGGDPDFVDRQLSCQFQWLDENGMYRDNSHYDVYQPIMYDLVSRGLFALLLHFGYRGKYYKKMDECLRKAGLLTLKMQSPNGEMAFGGRSNQFLHNEGWIAIVMEYEANRYAKEGNAALAKKFKSAIARALTVTEAWLSKQPIRHIKNRFPTETQFGCERYAYFDKYMITAASKLYAAYLICDDAIPAEEGADLAPSVFQTSYHFHKLFLKSGGYALELDTNADPIYDATGLGRVHRVGAPSTVCLSVPCPVQPKYTVDIVPTPLSLCCGIRQNGAWHFVADGSVAYEVVTHATNKESAGATLLCRFKGGRTVTEQYTVSENGVQIEVSGKGELAYMLPAFHFDGKTYTEIRTEKNTLSVTYDGWVCRYTTNGEILDLNRLAANRNGHYRAFAAIGKDTLRVKIEILKI